MCGIFGGSAKIGHKIDLKKIEILGLWNIQRGMDSCGYYYAGNIEKGVDGLKVFSDFLVEKPLTKGDIDCELFLGHTRKSTVGKNTIENAHPFVVNNYVQTHNGTIKNIWAQCWDNDIDTKDIHVDSHGLAAIIEKKGFDILEKYEGAAALAMTWVDKPNSLFLFHGKSREKRNEDAVEERPLFFIETKEGIYYSSMFNSLKHIQQDPEEKIYRLSYNKVVEIENGILKGVVKEINRENANIEPVVPIRSQGENGVQQSFFQVFPQTNIGNFTEGMASSCGKVISIDNGDLGEFKESYIYFETMPSEAKKQDVYHRFGRFFNDKGELLSGRYYINNAGKFSPDPQETRKFKMYHFQRGVMLKSGEDYIKLFKLYPDLETNMIYNFAKIISHYSRFPVINLRNEGISGDKFYSRFWFSDGVKANIVYQPKFSNRRYVLKSGLYHEATAKSKEKTMENVIFDFHSVKLHGQKSKEDMDFNKILRDTYMCCTLLIKKQDLINLPEYFLQFLDFYIFNLKGNEKLTSGEIEELTDLVLTDLIHTKQTFVQYLTELGERSFVNLQSIRKCFDGFDAEDLKGLTNRYEYISAQCDVDEYNEETLGHLLSRVEDLKVLISDLEAQDDTDPTVFNYKMEANTDLHNVQEQIKMLKK